MLQTLIDVANSVAPFFICLFILYIACGWILVFFKRDTLVKKYFTDNWDVRVGSVLYLLAAIAMMIVQLCVPVKPDELSPLAFILVMGTGMGIGIGIISFVVHVLIKYRNTITPQ